MAHFMVLSLPRSRSFWLSLFLSADGMQCAHDLLVQSKSLTDFETRLSLVDGSCETGAIVGWRLLRHRLPKLRLITVLRRPEEVIESIARKGYLVPKGVIESRFSMLEDLSCEENVFSFDYEELSNPAALESICAVAGVPWSQERCERLLGQNLQIDFAKRMSELEVAAPLLAGLNAEVALATAALRGSLACLN